MPRAPILTTLLTRNPDAGFGLAIRLSRIAVKLTQPDDDIRASLRAQYGRDPGMLIAASQVVATHFATIAAANNYWKGQQP
ncbi:MAG: hexameric tyrosine-coordinated heme protein [Brevundimonas sp.]|nr:hexameric tyrosine-coordinated heme protein [Brevundimonas sp.]